jgi:hypothetical protein
MMVIQRFITVENFDNEIIKNFRALINCTVPHKIDYHRHNKYLRIISTFIS